MADNELNVKVGANVEGLQKGLSNAEKSIKQFGGKANKAAAGTKKFGKSAANAGPAVQEFSRVIQDAPFGIQGVANNITQLTSQFGYLSKSAGGTVPALKAMLGSLAGPGGVLFAVSVVTSLLVSFGDELFGSSSAAEEAADANEELVKSLEKYENQLDQVSKAQLKGAKSAVKELTNISLLKAQIENTNLSNRERLDAYTELSKLYPGYIKSMSDEDVLAGGLKDSYNSLTAAILQKAKAQAAAELITENTKKQLVLEQQLEEKKLEAKQKNIEATKAEANAISAISGNQAGISTAIAKANTKREETNSLLEEEKKLGDDILSIQKKNAELANLISENGGILPFSGKGSGGDRSKNLSAIVTETGLAANDISYLSTNINESLSKMGEADSARLSNSRAKMSEELMMMQQLLIDFNNSANDLITNTIAGTFSKLGESIGVALATGQDVFKAIGTTLIQALGSFLSEMGKLLIEYGTLAVIKGTLDTAIATGGPVAVAAGIAAIAIGTALTAAGAAIGSFASGDGGSTSSAGGSSSYSSGGFSSSTGGGSVSSGGGTVVFEIQGSKLYGVLDNYLTRNNALGGNLGLGNG